MKTPLVNLPASSGTTPTCPGETEGPAHSATGSRDVGSALAEGRRRGGYQPQTAGHDPEAMKAAVRCAEIVILAVPWLSLDDVLGVIRGDLATRIVVDVT